MTAKRKAGKIILTSFIFMVLAIFSGSACSSEHSEEKAVEKISIREVKELSMNEFKAVLVAYNSPKAQELALEKYKIWITEKPEIYKVSFLLREREPLSLGQKPGFPSPTFEIGKDAFEIRRVYYGR